MLIKNFLQIARNDPKLVILKISRNYAKVLSKHSRKIVKLPLQITPNLSFLAGIIIGDGHLNKVKYRIVIEMTDIKIIELVNEISETLFQIKNKIKIREDKLYIRKTRYRIEINSKPIWKLFNLVFEIPSGKKSANVIVPNVIVGNKKLEQAFIEGLFLSDGGTRRNKIVFSSSSQMMQEGLQKLLINFEIKSSKSTWIHKYSKKPIYDLILYRKESRNKFKRIFPLSSYKIAGVA